MWKYLIPLFALSLLFPTAFSAEITRQEFLEATEVYTEIGLLKSLSESERHLLFAGMVESAGFTCSTVTHSLILGTDDDGSVGTTVRCENGKDYVILEGGNIPDGESRIMPCLHSTFVSGCWHPFAAK